MCVYMRRISMYLTYRKTLRVSEPAPSGQRWQFQENYRTWEVFPVVIGSQLISNIYIYIIIYIYVYYIIYIYI